MNAMVQDMSWDSIANGEGAGIFDLSADELENIYGGWRRWTSHQRYTAVIASVAVIATIANVIHHW